MAIVILEGRDVRPNGTLLANWRCARDFPGGWPDYSDPIVGAPSPPWERQWRELPGGEWVTTMEVREDGIFHTHHPSFPS